MKWKEVDNALIREFQFKTFADAIRFMSEAAVEIDKLDHHPEWTNVYNKLLVKLTTHSAGNKITEKDHQLSSILNTLYERF